MSAGRIDRVNWAFPSAPKRINKPSWMGIPAATLDDQPVSSVSAPSSVRPPHESVTQQQQHRTPTLPPPPSSRSFAQALASVIPPAISTMREVELESEVTVLKGQIAQLAKQLAGARAQAFADSELEILKLAVAIATRIVGLEVDADPSMILPWIREGIAMLPGDDVTVAVASDVAEHLTPEALASELPKAKRCVVDGSLPPGAVEVREGNGTIEVGADARIAAMSDALGLDGTK